MKRVFLSFLTTAFSVSLLAQAPVLKIFKRDTNASTYHTADCPFVKSAGYTMVPATLDDAMSSRLSACTVCHPERDPGLVAAIAAAREVKADEERAAAARAKAAADTEAATAKAAADAKAAAVAADVKRLEAVPVVRLTSLRLRPIVTSLVTTSKNEVAVFDQKFREAINKLAPDYEGPVSIVEQRGLTVTALGPVARMHVAARDAVRKLNPMPAVVWANELQILVSPSRIDSPDIENIIVERNGVVVPALRSNLLARELTTATGAKARLHSGDVTFPLASFNNGSGVVVKITLIPASGDKIVRTLNSIALRKLQ